MVVFGRKFKAVAQNVPNNLLFRPKSGTFARLKDEDVKGAPGAPFSHIIKASMITKEQIAAIAADYLKQTDLTFVKARVSKDNDIMVFITREGGSVCIDDCVELSRYIESRLDRDKEDFSLTVSSTGVRNTPQDEDEE